MIIIKRPKGNEAEYKFKIEVVGSIYIMRYKKRFLAFLSTGPASVFHI